MLTPHKAHFRKAPEAVAKLFLALGFSPNGITLFGLSLGLATCLFYYFNHNASLFGFLMIVFGLFDAVDGAAARITGRITKFGSYLDAMCDRIFESAAVLVTAYVTGYWVLCLLLAIGGLLISYAKARAAMEIPVSNTAWPDLMERTERDIIFAVGMIVWGFFPKLFFSHSIFYWVLVGLNIAVYITVLQRILRAKRYIESAS